MLSASLTGFSQNTKLSNTKDLVTIDQLLTLLEAGESVVDKTLVMSEVNFEFGKATLTEDAKLYLNKVVRLLNAIDNIHLKISGHSDNVGNAKSNLKLSEERAISVYYYLIESGVSATRLTHAGFGDQIPIADNRTESGRDKNRRVTFDIVQVNSTAKTTHLQDVIFLTNGTKIGAYNIKTSSDTLYYNRFTDGGRSHMLMGNIDRINFSNGKIYQHQKNQPSNSATKSYTEDPWVTRHEKGDFLYSLRYLDVSQGINFSRLTSNSEFKSVREWFWRMTIGYDFYRRILKGLDSTGFRYRTNQFLRKTGFYLRAETGLCGQGGYFHDRIQTYFSTKDLRYGIAYWENTLVLQKTMLKDNLNLHAGLSALIRISEGITGGGISFIDQKLTRPLDLQLNIGMFFRMPWWRTDLKWGMRYNWGLIDVSNNRLVDNPFYEELNFNRTFSLSLKLGV